MTTRPEPIALNHIESHAQLKPLSPDWHIDDSNEFLYREFRFGGYARAVQLANLAAWLATEQGHHPDIEFGWGYCRIRLTTHDAGGLSRRDFEFASAMDKILQTGSP